MTKQQWKKKLTCGQMARANHISEKTLRFYQQKGLLEPVEVNDKTGYRFYDILQSTKLDLITHLQQIGFSLDEILEIDTSKDLELLVRKTDEHLQQIREEQQRLAVAEHLAQDLMTDCNAYRKAPVFDQIMMENMEPRFWLAFDYAEEQNRFNLSGDLTESDRWEWVLRFVKSEISRRGWPSSLFRNVGGITTWENIFSDKPPFEKPFVFVDETFGECFKQAEPCPLGLTLTLYVDNGYDPEGESLDHKRYERMHDYAEKKNLIPSADPYCESICRIPRLLNQSYETYTRYCVPVKRS